MARLRCASTTTGSQGQGYVSAGNGSPVPSQTGNSHTAMQHQNASTAIPTCGLTKLSPKHRLPPAAWQLSHSGAKGAARTDPCTRIQRQTKQSPCQKPYSHQQPHPASSSTGCPHPARCSRKEPDGCGSSLRLLAKPKAAQLAPSVTSGSPVKPGMCLLQANAYLLKGMLVLAPQFRAH